MSPKQFHKSLLNSLKNYKLDAVHTSIECMSNFKYTDEVVVRYNIWIKINNDNAYSNICEETNVDARSSLNSAIEWVKGIEATDPFINKKFKN